MPRLPSHHRANAAASAAALLAAATALTEAMRVRSEDTEGAARDLLTPAELALAKAQEVVRHLRARVAN